MSICSPICLLFLLSNSAPNSYLHSFPTRRSSDLEVFKAEADHQVLDRSNIEKEENAALSFLSHIPMDVWVNRHTMIAVTTIDRKSKRLNSSHLGISYAVFCLKKKKQRKKYN